MKRLYIITPLLAVAIVCSVFLFTHFVTAQNAGQGLEISPPSQELTIDPGKTKEIKAKIRNRSNGPLPIEARIEDFTAKDEEGQVALTADSPYSVASWTTLTPKKFTLEAGEEQEVTVTIDAPADAAGGRFGAVVFSVKPEKPAGVNAATVSQEVASLFLVRVSGPVSEKLTLSQIAAPQFSEFGPVPFDLKFENSGNVHVKVYGLINVTNMFGQKVADIVVPGVNIFPGAKRIVKSSLNQQFLFGPHTVTAIMYYGANQTQSLTATTSFFVFPVRIALAAIVVLIIIFFLFRKRSKKSKKGHQGK